MNNCIHVASITDVVQSWQFIKLALLQQVLRIKLLKIIILSNILPSNIALLIDIFDCDSPCILYLNYLSSVHNTFYWKINLCSIVGESLSKKFLLSALADIIESNKIWQCLSGNKGQVCAWTIEYLLRISWYIFQLFPILFSRIFVEACMSQLAYLSIATHCWSFFALYFATGIWEKFSIVLYCHFDDDIIVNFRIYSLYCWATVVNCHHSSPDLFLNTNVVMQLAHVFD